MGPGEETRSQTTAEYIEPGLKWEPLKGEKRVHSGLAFSICFLSAELLEFLAPTLQALVDKSAIEASPQLPQKAQVTGGDG